MPRLMSGPVKPTSLEQQDIDLARESGDALAEFANVGDGPIRVSLESGQTGKRVEATVPARAVRVLAEALARMAEGQSITVLSANTELSTQQAAELLGVSRPYFVKLLETGKMRFRKVGAQRRVPYVELLRYMAEFRVVAHSALDEMAGDAQSLGLYDSGR